MQNEEKIEEINIYEQYIGDFVNVTKKDGRIAKGVLSMIVGTKLSINGKYNNWVIDIDMIADFSARPNKEQDKGMNYEQD